MLSRTSNAVRLPYIGVNPYKDIYMIDLYRFIYFQNKCYSKFISLVEKIYTSRPFVMGTLIIYNKIGFDIVDIYKKEQQI